MLESFVRFSEVSRATMGRNDLWGQGTGPERSMALPRRVGAGLAWTMSKPRVDRFAFQCKDAEDAFVDPAQWLPADKPFQPLDAEGELAEG
jgi:hypothetical protein